MILSILTFPGVIAHEMAHALMCRLLGVHVVKTCYFRLGNPMGYVLHDRPQSAIGSILISVGPFVFNTIAGFAIGSAAILPHLRSIVPMWSYWLMLWLAVSVSMHSFPSTGDAKNVWQVMWARRTPTIVRIIALPIVLLIYLGAIGSVIWLDILYGIAIGVIAPHRLGDLLTYL